MVPAVESSFEVALWFLDRALGHGEYMQPQKLHRLLYLAQAYFGAAHDGRMLMPATFVADSLGPIEPNVYAVLSSAAPSLEHRRMEEGARQFLDVVWRRFGQHTAEYLSKVINGHAPYRDALAKGERTVITLDSMVEFYGRKAAKNAAMPDAGSLVPPRLMRSQSGQAVEVRKWAPAVKKTS